VDSLISETKLSKQLRLPDFLVTVEEYNIIQEPPMRNFKHLQQKSRESLGADRILGIKVARRAKDDERIQHLCTPLNAFLFFWLCFVIVAAVWIIVDELIPNL
jgi:hypothetical protein